MGQGAKMKLILFLTLTFFCSLYPAGPDGLVDTKNSEKGVAPSKEEGGIMATMVSIYSVTREAVKFAYDEIIYFENMYQTYDKIKNWYKGNQARKGRIFDLADKIVNDPEDIFVTLRRMEEMFDEIDNLALQQPYELDKILSGGEFWWDQMAARNNQYGTGLIVPNTQGVVDYIEGLFIQSSSITIPNSAESSTDSLKIEQLLKRKKLIDEIASMDMSNWPYERIRKAAFLIASTSLSTSSQYLTWSMYANNSMRENQKNFEGIKGINGNLMKSAWWSIETNNSNNKEILHQIELLKNMTAILGVDVFMHSDTQNDYLKLRNSMQDLKIKLSQANSK